MGSFSIALAIEADLVERLACFRQLRDLLGTYCDTCLLGDKILSIARAGRMAKRLKPPDISKADSDALVASSTGMLASRAALARELPPKDSMAPADHDAVASGFACKT